MKIQQVASMIVTVCLTIGCGGSIGDGNVQGPGSPSLRAQAVQPSVGIVLIDRTGSMMDIRPGTGNTRCHDALIAAQTKVDAIFSLGGTGVDVWTFNGTTAQSVTGGYVPQLAATNAISGLSKTDCKDSTPLAQAICSAADQLALTPTPPGSGKSNLLAIITDGYENNSNPTSPCYGNKNDGRDLGSWRSKVAGYLAARQIVADTDYLQSNYLRLVDPETGKERMVPHMSDGSPIDLEHETMLNLAIVTGGTYQLMNDADSRYACRFRSCPAPYYTPVIW